MVRCTIGNSVLVISLPKMTPEEQPIHDQFQLDVIEATASVG